MASNWQDIRLRDQGGGTDIVFAGAVSGWLIPVTDNDLRLLLARTLERAGARYEVRDDRNSARDTDSDGRPFTAETAARYARFAKRRGSSAYCAVTIVPLDA